MSTIKDMWVVGTIDFAAGSPCRFTALNTIVHSVN